MSSTAAQNRFERIANAVGISSAGKSWLIAAVDPFHDEPITDLRGLPDGVNSNSVVQIVKSTATIKAPASAGTGSWDCHVQSLPFTKPTAESVGYTPYIKNSDVLGNQDTPNFLVSETPLQIPLGSVTVNSNATTVPATKVGIFGGTQAGQERTTLTPSSNYTSGAFRVIAKGYEIISSGPNLYRSGVCYVYGLPVANSQQTETVNVTGVNQASTVATVARSMLRFPEPPLTADEAMKIPGCQSWNASEGAYMIDRLSDPHVSTFSSSGIVGICHKEEDGPDSDTPLVVGTKKAFITTFGNPITVSYSLISSKYINISSGYNGGDVEPFNFSGVYFTGLNAQDILTVNVIWYIERLPDENQPDLLVLAKPTPHMDPAALDMYSVIMSEMPWGMVQKANSFGDFFKDVVDVVSNTVAPVLSALPGTAGIVGKVGTVGGKILGGLLGGGNRGDQQKVNPPAPYNKKGTTEIFLEEPNGKIHVSKKPTAKEEEEECCYSFEKSFSGSEEYAKEEKVDIISDGDRAFLVEHVHFPGCNCPSCSMFSQYCVGAVSPRELNLFPAYEPAISFNESELEVPWYKRYFYSDPRI